MIHKKVCLYETTVVKGNEWDILWKFYEQKRQNDKKTVTDVSKNESDNNFKGNIREQIYLYKCNLI